jgi:DHA3 family tetracycline resistance protein-like MFS transporter
VGDRLYLIAMAWWVVSTTGSVGAMSAVLLANVIPTIALVLVGGVAVDRWSRAGLMLASDVIRGLLVAVAAALATLGSLDLAVMIGISAAFGAVDAFFDPAYSAIVPQLVELELRPSANALSELSRRASRLVGPALGAVVISVGGVSMAFALDGLSFGLSAAGMLVVARTTDTTVSRKRADRPLADLREGLRAVTSVPWLWITIAVAAVTNITLAGPLEAAMPRLVTVHFDGGVELLGALDSLMGAGAVAAAIWLGRQRRYHHRGPTIYVAWIGCGLAVATLGLPLPIPVAGAVFIIIGATLTTLELVWMHTLQELVPEELLGRVSSVDILGSAAFVPVGYVLTGTLADAYGPATVFVVGGLATAAILLFALFHPAVRALD